MDVYLDVRLSLEERVDDLVSRMTLEEKISQMTSGSKAIERLAVPYYHWWNECLHGVGRAGIATVFPQAIGLASTWNTALIHRAGEVISDEARAKHHQAVRDGIRTIYTGLNFWTPNINIFRDPRWGRGQETYGEDPYLTARIAVAFIRGLQGDDPHYLKIAACAKHFAVHSGPEANRHSFNAFTNPRDLWETYLPAFEASVREARVESVMGAYNRLNGEACCASPTLLQTILREQWGFEGHVVSDCGAIDDIYRDHGLVETAAEAAALSVKAGCDLNCGDTYKSLGEAVEQGLIDEAAIDQAVKRLFRTRFRLGMFDPPERVPYTQIPIEVNACDAHSELALQVARESMVLLKNSGNILPLSKDLKSIAVLGPNADDVQVLLGNYNGTPKAAVTPLEGIRRAVSPQTQVYSAKGCELKAESADFEQAVELARQADVAVLVMGLSQALEGEEGETPNVGDRTLIELPQVQEKFIAAVHATGTPVVLVLINGSPLAVRWADENVAAILEAWYPGQAAGTAIAGVLFGDYNPAGRLPVTFYAATDDLPPFADYTMEGRTYRYLRRKPLYPFGYGLSYTHFSYRDLSATHHGDRMTVQVTVTNDGQRDGDEVVQLYLSDHEPGAPVCHLEGFTRIHLRAGNSQTVIFNLKPEQLTRIDSHGQRTIRPETLIVSVGGGQPGYAEHVSLKVIP